MDNSIEDLYSLLDTAKKCILERKFDATAYCLEELSKAAKQMAKGFRDLHKDENP